MKKVKFALLAGAALAGLASPALAERGSVNGTDLLNKERFQVRARALGVVPQEDSTVDIGGETKVGNAITGEVDLTYFFTDHIAAELIAGTAHHNVRYGGASMGNTWVLPPTLTVQYHFTPDRTFSPYVGAGLNYSIFYNEKGTNFNDFDIDNGVGVALQAGADYWITKNFGLNLDVKKIFLNVDASVENGAANADIDLDPWLIGAGVSYRF